MRIVSLLPSATEIVYALGLGDQLDGVTFDCDHPPEARSKPVVSDTTLPQDRPLTAREIDRLTTEIAERGGSIHVLDTGMLAQIRPDLVITQDLCPTCAVPTAQVREALKGLGIQAEVVSLDPRTLDDVLESVLTVGVATGTEPRAKEIVDGLRARVEAVRRRVLPLPTIRALCIEWGDPPYVAGHWVPQMVEIAGGANAMGKAGEPSFKVTWHQVGVAAPEVIVFMPCGYYLEDAEAEAELLYRLPEFAETPAARARAVYAVDATSYFSRPGPRIVDGLEILAWAIHPDAFPEPSADRITRIEGST
jgi:iron complex transport system substrate-binding protein